MTAFPQAINASASPEVQTNENFLALQALGTYSHNAVADSGLVRGYSGGRWGGFSVADVAHTFAASTTTYVSVKRSDGTFDFSTSNTHYNDSTNYARVETVVSTTTALTITDDRSGPGGVHGGGGGASFVGGTLTSALNEAPTVTIASSSTPAIGAAAGNSILLTGTTGVTGFDAIAAGAFRRVRFGGVLTLTYNATSLILPTSANIVTAANDVAEFLSLGSGNWFCTSYTRASGQSLVASAGDGIGATSAGVNAQTGTTYTVVSGDAAKEVGFSNSAAIAVTLPQAGSTGFASGWSSLFRNTGGGVVTVTPTTSTIDGAVALTLRTGDAVIITSDGTNYAIAFIPSGSVPVNSQSAGYTLTMADRNGLVYHPAADTTPRTWTIPANSSVPFPIGTTATFDNDIGAGALTIAITSDTLVLVGAAGSTGSRTIAAGGQATAVKVTATRWRINGTLLT